MDILITGSSGMIGTRTCERLLKDKYKVQGLDKKPNRWNSEIDKLTRKVNLLKGGSLKKLGGGFDCIIHLAANARVYELVKNPKLSRDNFDSLFNILEYARTEDIPFMIFGSSREVYGNADRLPLSENEMFVSNCESSYSASKIGGEALIHSYSQCYGLDFSILRFSNVYGRYDDSNRVVPNFIKRTKMGKDLVVYGKEKLLDFTYIDDAVDGIMKCLKKSKKAKNETFNIASGEGHTLIELANLIRSEMDGKNSIKTQESRTGEVIKFVADISKARKLLDYKPRTSFREGIKKTVEWYQDNLYG